MLLILVGDIGGFAERSAFDDIFGGNLCGDEVTEGGGGGSEVLESDKCPFKRCCDWLLVFAILAFRVNALLNELRSCVCEKNLINFE